ncbi:MAG: hypothetical protein K6F69_07415 [Treponema sp.]|nr:hypothetical protein [Treponema sp.]
MNSTDAHVMQIFASKSVNSFSVDGVLWFNEGDLVNVKSAGKLKKNSVVKSVNENGDILLGFKGRTLMIRLKDISFIERISGELVECFSNGIYAIREEKAFSLDLVSWNKEGKKYLVMLDGEILINAMIVNIKDSGYVMFDNGICQKEVYYKDIISIYDQEEEIRLLMEKDSSPLLSFNIYESCQTKEIV